MSGSIDTTSSNNDASRSKDDSPSAPPLKVVFVHLDLGIGGAEQLVLQLAIASQDLGHDVSIVTTRCDSDHCFDAVKKSTNGRLSNDVYIYGSWLPVTILGVGTALCSTIRMLYITYQVTRFFKTADVVVVDVLPTSIPLVSYLLPTAGTLFYCHFPDKLLLRGTGGGSSLTQWTKQQYRRVLDSLEEATMGCAHTLVVNSKFTLSQVEKTFPSLFHHDQQQKDESSSSSIEVLYPALDTSTMVQPSNQPKTSLSPIVSLNRFERKKNIELLIHAYALFKKRISEEHSQQKQKQTDDDPPKLPKLIIAGGYDTKNHENVEYRGELQSLVDKLELKVGQEVQFLLDISDQQRATLFQTALCVVYTPDKEHFGIVPLEAMYAQTPVIAVNSGGPKETVIDGKTGYLKSNTPEEFASGIESLYKNPEIATMMGYNGRIHVEQTFGPKRFEKEWKVLIEETKRRQKQQQLSKSSSMWILWCNTAKYFFEAFLALLLVLLLTWILRYAGFINSSQSILGGVRQRILGRHADEL